MLDKPIVRRLIALIIVIFTLFLYFLYCGPVLNSGFLFDDYHEVVDNPALKAGFLEAVKRQPFRAVQELTYRVDYLFGGPQPYYFHLTSVILHLLASALVALFWKKVIKQYSAKRNIFNSFITLIIFISCLFFPLNIQAFSYISARGDLLVTIFTVAACYSILNYIMKGKTARIWYIGALILQLLALLSKESAIITCLLISAVYWLNHSKNEAKFEINTKSRIINHFMRLAPFYLMTAIWIMLRLVHKIDYGGQATSHDITFIQKGACSFASYLKLAFHPIGLSIDHGHFTNCDIIYLALPLIVTVSLLLFFFFMRKKIKTYLNTELSLIVIWYLIAIAPAVLLPLADPVAEHRAYLANCAIIALPAIIILISKERKETTSYSAFICCTIIIFWGINGAKYIKTWQSESIIWKNAVRVNPNNARAWLGLGSALLEENKTKHAKKALLQSTKLDQNLAKAESNLGIIAMNEGKMEEAHLHFKRAIQIEPASWRDLINLASLEERKGNFAEQQSLLENAIKINNKNSIAWFNYGNALKNNKKYQEAIIAYKQSLILNPDDLNPRINIAHIYENLSEYDKAILELKMVLGRNPDSEKALLTAARISDLEGDVNNSIAFMERYLKLKKDDKNAWKILAYLLEKAGRKTEAEDALRKANAH